MTVVSSLFMIQSIISFMVFGSTKGSSHWIFKTISYSGYISATSATLSLQVLCLSDVITTSFVNVFVLFIIPSSSVAITTLSAFDFKQFSKVI
jgi:hypothetical protein